MDKIKNLHIEIAGIVQGVGFRPFVYNLAKIHQIFGWIKNTSSGIIIEVEGSEVNLNAFTAALSTNAPPLASIDKFLVTEQPYFGFREFEIITSQGNSVDFQPISPDISICADCEKEINDPQDRRYRYPFTNCTNCGPRFTIIKDIPYDRPMTSMQGFQMCPECLAEYKDPENRRFHAQPIACPNCGPSIWLETIENTTNNHENVPALVGEMALQEARKMIKEGKIVAIKGLGGFHLACDATNVLAVKELRAKKLRVDKPFAVMMTNLDTVRQHCDLSELEQTYLESPAHPIILLEKKIESNIDQLVAPNQRTLGVMLPYTPLHILLLQQDSGFPGVLVMTSGNLSEEPICTDNLDAKSTLGSIADAFLMHNRDILIRTDDSVIQTFHGEQYPVRRSRGYSPYPVKLHRKSPPVLATGGELKNTFCVTRDNYAFLSHHIGDLKNYESLKSFEDGIQHFEQIFRVLPNAIACDQHPDYFSTRYAIERSKKENIKLVSVQHHHAHIASLMSEHGMEGKSPIIGVVFDGTGYGADGNIWGGEFLIANYLQYQRYSHLKYFPLPGGDAATKHPNRVSLGLLYSMGISWENATNTSSSICEADRTLVRSLLEKKINTPLTSSVGRLFDAIASLVGLRHSINYEAQAAIELEACIDQGESGTYHFETENGFIDPKPVIEAIIADLHTGLAINRISGKFHNSLALMVRNVCTEIRKENGISEVGLSGGVWQNISLLRKSVELLEKDGFSVLLHKKVPTNDGGIALGQAAVCVAQLSQ